MAGIAFLQIPIGFKVPGVISEFDTSKAQQGVAIKFYNALLIGQKLADGTKAAGQIDKITSDSQARQFYGKGSQLFHIAKSFIGQNKGLNEVNTIALDDGGAVKAAGSYEILTPPTADGTLSLMLAGKRYRVPVLDADDEADVISNLVTEITADEDRQITVAINGGNSDLMDITARNGGTPSNDIDIRENFFDGEELPEGITSAIVAMSGGSGSPSIASVIAAMGETQFDVIVMPYSDAANLLLMKNELDDRWQPLRQIDGHLFVCRKEDFATHSTFLDGRNSEQETVMNITGPTPQWEWAANIAAQVAANAQVDPARPFQTLPLSQVLAPKDAELFDLTERNLILNAGSSTYNVDSGGSVRIERLRTTRIENEFAAPDEALADLNPKLTLSFIRFDFRVLMSTRYPRHKLADDGVKFAPGQPIITPKVGKAEAVGRFELWQELGLVEGLAQFKRDLIVVRNSQSVTQLDFLLSPDLVNQLRVVGVQIGFLL